MSGLSDDLCFQPNEYQAFPKPTHFDPAGDERHCVAVGCGPGHHIIACEIRLQRADAFFEHRSADY